MIWAMADLDSLASQPKKASNSNGSMESHSLKEQIELDRYSKSQKLRNGWKLGVARNIPSGPRG